jgi:hypothetical protein
MGNPQNKPIETQSGRQESLNFKRLRTPAFKGVKVFRSFYQAASTGKRTLGY